MMNAAQIDALQIGEHIADENARVKRLDDTKTGKRVYSVVSLDPKVLGGATAHTPERALKLAAWLKGGK